eukprot:839682-Rhodomonas_salina.3
MSLLFRHTHTHTQPSLPNNTTQHNTPHHSLPSPLQLRLTHVFPGHGGDHESSRAGLVQHVAGGNQGAVADERAHLQQAAAQPQHAARLLAGGAGGPRHFPRHRRGQNPTHASAMRHTHARCLALRASDANARGFVGVRGASACCKFLRAHFLLQASMWRVVVSMETVDFNARRACACAVAIALFLMPADTTWIALCSFC